MGSGWWVMRRRCTFGHAHRHAPRRNDRRIVSGGGDASRSASAQGVHLGRHGRDHRRRVRGSTRAGELRVSAGENVDDRRSIGRDTGRPRCRRDRVRGERFARQRRVAADRQVSLGCAHHDRPFFSPPARHDGRHRFELRRGDLHRLSRVDVEHDRSESPHDVERAAHTHRAQRDVDVGSRHQRGDRGTLWSSRGDDHR